MINNTFRPTFAIPNTLTITLRLLPTITRPVAVIIADYSFVYLRAKVTLNPVFDRTEPLVTHPDVQPLDVENFTQSLEGNVNRLLEIVANVA